MDYQKQNEYVARVVNEMNHVNAASYALTNVNPMVFKTEPYYGGGPGIQAGNNAAVTGLIGVSTPTAGAYVTMGRSGFGQASTHEIGGGFKPKSKLGKNLQDVAMLARSAAPAVAKVKAKARASKGNKSQVEATPIAAAEGLPKLEGAAFKGRGKTAKFLKAVGHFVKPAAPLVKKIKRAVAPVAEQALQQAAMSAMTGGKRPPSAWVQHVMAVRKANPGMSYKNAMVKAKENWKK